MDFESFWSEYPRKVAKAHARVMWNRLTESEKEAAIAALPIHKRVWDAEGREVACIPHAATWLNPVLGRRWEDELEMPVPKPDTGWKLTEQGILREGARKGLVARPGESLWDFRARIEAA